MPFPEPGAPNMIPFTFQSLRLPFVLRKTEAQIEFIFFQRGWRIYLWETNVPKVVTMRWCGRKKVKKPVFNRPRNWRIQKSYCQLRPQRRPNNNCRKGAVFFDPKFAIWLERTWCESGGSGLEEAQPQRNTGKDTIGRQRHAETCCVHKVASDLRENYA